MDVRVALVKKKSFEDFLLYGKNQGLLPVYCHLDNLSPQELAEKLKGYPALVCGGIPIPREVIEELKDDLKIICRLGAGYDEIDLEAAREYGIPVCNTPGANAAAVADQAIMLMLALGRHICHYNQSIRQGKWTNKPVGQQLEGKTVGLLGFGNVAKTLACYLKGFKCTILVHDDYVPDYILEEKGAARASIEDIVRKSDYISLHLPLTNETRCLVNAEFFSKMKPTAFLINTCRGEVVEEKALIDALKNGKIAGAGLDVFCREPIESDNPLLEMNQVILSPHVAYNSEEANKNTARMAAEIVSDYLMNGKLNFVVNGI